MNRKGIRAMIPKQDTFNALVWYARELAQRNLFSARGTTCLYRSTTEDGRSICCPVGFLIPDNLYRREMEGGAPAPADDISKASQLVCGVLEQLGHNLNLCAVFQREVHDECFDHYSWKNVEKYIADVALEFGLTVPPVVELARPGGSMRTQTWDC